MTTGGAGGGAWYWLNRERPVEVEVVAVTERAAGTQASVLNASGYVTARRRATVSSKVTGKIIEMNVEEGMAVREGQVLARAQLEATRQAVPEIEVRLAEARINLRRQEQLMKDGLTTPSAIDQGQAEVNSLLARISSTREQIKVAQSQVALSKDAQPGEMVSPVSAGGGFTRTGISTIVDMRSLEIEVDVNESEVMPAVGRHH